VKPVVTQWADAQVQIDLRRTKQAHAINVRLTTPLSSALLWTWHFTSKRNARIGASNCSILKATESDMFVRTAEMKSDPTKGEYENAAGGSTKISPVQQHFAKSDNNRLGRSQRSEVRRSEVARWFRRFAASLSGSTAKPQAAFWRGK
jgi:hypothetical protein